MAVDKTYYSYPTAKRLRDTARVLMYDNLSGSRNVTGTLIRRDVLGGNVGVNTNTDYVRVMEIKDTLGVIISYIQGNGKMTMGTPLSLSISSVSPTNGATNVSNGTWFNYSSTVGGYDYWGRLNMPVPTINFNKYDAPSTGTLTPARPGGGAWKVTGGTGSLVFSNHSGTYFNNFSGAAGTTYTMRFTRIGYTQTDGETTSSCGAMTVNGNYCDSTFIMR
jgi:hypothetical protein